MRRNLSIVCLSSLIALGCAIGYRAPVDDRVFLYRSVNFDIAYIASAVPSVAAFNKVKTSMQDHGICIETRVTFNTRLVDRLDKLRLWSIAELQAFESVNNGRPSHESNYDTMTVFVAYVCGDLIPSIKNGRNICGYTYNTTSFVVLANQFNRRDEEAALLLHELGHVMNPPGDDHCPDSNCIMYELVRKDGTPFCKSCIAKIADLRVNRH